MTDSFEAKGKRKKLVEELRKKGISDEDVLNAIDRVPRHLFMDPAFLIHAYADKAFPITSGQTISQPYIVALMTELCDLDGNEKVLEIGTGSGYQAAVLAERGADVISIERSPGLHGIAAQRLAELGYAVRLVVGDGTLGWPAGAPYDGIVATGSLPRIPQELLSQLAPHGRLVAPVGGLLEQTLLVVDSTSPHIRQRFLCDCRFVPLVGVAGWRPDTSMEEENHATD